MRIKKCNSNYDERSMGPTDSKHPAKPTTIYSITIPKNAAIHLPQALQTLAIRSAHRFVIDLYNLIRPFFASSSAFNAAGDFPFPSRGKVKPPPSPLLRSARRAQIAKKPRVGMLVRQGRERRGSLGTEQRRGERMNAKLGEQGGSKGLTVSVCIVQRVVYIHCHDLIPAVLDVDCLVRLGMGPLENEVS